MPREQRDSADRDRRRFIADPVVLGELDMTVEDLGNPDARALAIHAEHPEFEEALEQDLDEVDLGDGPISPGLHLAMHEIVATQLWDDSPPEVWETAVRLRDAGYGRHEILHMLGRPVSEQIWAALHEDRPYDRDQHVASLRALPESWEAERATRTANRRHDEGRKQARRQARAARRRNRRP